MTFFGKTMRAIAVILAVGAGTMNAKPAQADGGAVVAGIAGGLILGTIIGSTANANHHTYAAPVQTYHAPAPTYYAPAPTYYAPASTYYAPAPIIVPRPYYGSTLSFSFGKSYRAPKRYRKRAHGYRHYRGNRGHRAHRRHNRHNRRHH